MSLQTFSVQLSSLYDTANFFSFFSLLLLPLSSLEILNFISLAEARVVTQITNDNDNHGLKFSVIELKGTWTVTSLLSCKCLLSENDALFEQSWNWNLVRFYHHHARHHYCVTLTIIFNSQQSTILHFYAVCSHDSASIQLQLCWKTGSQATFVLLFQLDDELRNLIIIFYNLQASLYSLFSIFMESKK